MTTCWGAPRRTYEITRYLAAVDREALDFLWKGLSAGDRTDSRDNPVSVEDRPPRGADDIPRSLNEP